MQKYGVVVVTGLSVAAGVLLGLGLGEAYGKPPRKQRLRHRVVVQQKATPKPEPQPEVEITIGDEPGPLPQIGDEHFDVFNPFNMVAGPCMTSAEPNSPTGGSYSPFWDKASTYWTISCSNGTSSGCQWSFYVYLARGSYGLYNPPGSWLFAGCANAMKFSCGESDNSRAVYLNSVKDK